jgi:hypothetical protein
MSGDRDERDGEGKEPSFRVIDRRRFAPDGSEREPESSPEDEEPPRPPPGPDSTPPSDRGASARAEPGGDEADRLGRPQGAPYDPEEAAGQPSFATLVLSLSTQALMCLGEIAEAPGAEPHQDLVAARSIIDLLAVLEQKTKGNLTEDEEALLERILYDLRMRFVQLSGSRR